jgi:hypothetical protein
MTRMRRALGPAAIVWLCCQAAPLLAAPLVIWMGAPAELVECTCTHGDHAMCPMHHKRAAGSTLCLMRSTNGGDTAVLASMFHFAGVLTTLDEAVVPQPADSHVSGPITTASRRPAPPDPPPPRA